jgi:DHA1 family bicyclomycin/chloramphenicol resistance-like MFS transporter
MAGPAEVDRVAVRIGDEPPARRRRFLLMVGGLSLFGPLCIDMYLPALPRIATDLHSSASEVQLSLTSCLVGLAVGQLIIGPLSDRHGRRPPLIAGLALFIVASFTCAASPTTTVLVLLRFAQGFGGAAGIVIARAVVRDLFSGVAAARFFSLLMLVTGAGPVLAPQIGAELLRLTSWRGVFVVLGVAGSLLLAMAILRLPETLPAHGRDVGGLRATLRGMHTVATSRTFVANALACGLGFGAIFAYVSGSSFVMEDVYQLSPQVFGLLFALNGCGLVAASQVNARIVGRFGSARILTFGLLALAAGGVAALIVVAIGGVGLIGLVPCLFVCVSCNGFVGPNAMALSLNDFPEAAGSASALLGVLQFGIGAAVAPLVGIGGSHDALPMATAMAVFGLAATTVRFSLTRPVDRAPRVAVKLEA